jgi:hypothetical protein
MYLKINRISGDTFARTGRVFYEHDDESPFGSGVFHGQCQPDSFCKHRDTEDTE